MTLSPHHYTMLHNESAIDDHIITTRGYQSITHPDDLRDLGFSKVQARTAPALVLPLWDVHGEQAGWQIRPDSPRMTKDGKVFKYENPKGSRLHLDVHPSVHPLLGDPSTPLWITEGIKKGDALASRGQCTIALMGGVWGFKGTNEHGGKVILPEWQHIALNGRLVYVVYDSDIYSKPDVEKALKALYIFLRERQALPGLVHWPEAFRQRKWGADDFFADGHSLEELVAMVPPIGPLPTTYAQRRNGHVPPATHTPGAAAIGTADEDYPYSDAYNAWCLVKAHRQEMRYCSTWKAWLTWTGTHWQRETTGLMLRWQRETVMALGTQLATLGEAAAKALLEHIKSSLSTSRLKAAVDQAQSWEGISIDADVLDTDAWLLNCANGTLNLHTGKVRPHLQTDMLTKCLSIVYDSNATCPIWEQFLWRIMGGTQTPDDPDMSIGELENRRVGDQRATELIAYLQRAAGYTLTGSTREQCLFLCHGPTKTGKSTYLATIRALLGAYGKQADIQTFMHKDRAEVRNDLADLAGARYVYAVEAQEGKRLAENLIKQMTGGVDAIKARFLFEEYFEFKPQFKAYIGTNHKPVIKDSDDAIWERIRLVPFTVQIPKDQRDKGLEEKLIQELPGILAWAVRGCLDWLQGNDLKEPPSVLAATEGYRIEMDIVARFLEECCRFHEQFRIKAGDLHNAFTTWCEGTGVPHMTLKEFGKRLDDKGFEKRSSNFVWRIGVTLKDT